MRRVVSASELARFSYCEVQWEIENRFRFDAMSDHHLARLARRGQRSRDPHAHALGLAAAAHLQRVRPALLAGERYHTEDARKRVSRPRPLTAFFVVLAALALLALAIR